MKSPNLHSQTLQNLIFSIILLIVNGLSASGQTFQTAIGYPLPTEERGASGLITSAGYLVLGSNLQHPSGFFNAAGDLQLVRLDNFGNLIQPAKIIGQDVGESAVWFEHASDCNGTAGYIIAGNEYNGPARNMLLTFTNPAGNPVWVRRVGTLADDESAACVKQDGARNFILVGTKTDANTGFSVVQAIKTDCNGNLLWERTYTLPGSATAASVTAFATFPQTCTGLPNEYFITGKTVSSQGVEEVFILSIAATNGSPSWLSTYDVAPNADDAGTCIQGACTPNVPTTGGLWVSGYSHDASATDPKKLLMLHTDFSGNVLWANNYDVQNSKLEFVTHFQFAANDKLVLTGKAEDPGVSDPPESGKCFLLRMNTGGNALDWTRVYDIGYASQGNRVEPTAADEYFISGHTYEIIQPQQFDYNILAIKTDQQGQVATGCFHTPNTLIINRQPIITPLAPIVAAPQDFSGASLLTVLYDEQQTFCAPPPPDPCDSMALNAAFNLSISGNTLACTDLSTVGSGSIFAWQWDFGDSNTSNLQNPTHTYAGPGVYTVCLVISGGANGVLCRDTICKTIEIIGTPHDPCDSLALNANFNVFSVVGNTVTFNDLSSGSITQWDWDFGDAGTATFNAATNPVHTYPGPGAYVVCLVVTYADAVTICRDTICKDIIIESSGCDFSDDYSTNTGWTQVGTLVNIASGVVQYQNSAPDGQQRRIHKPLGFLLNANDTWQADLDVTPQAVGGSAPSTGHAVLALTSTTAEPHSNCPNVACTGYPLSAQDAVNCNFSSLASGTNTFFEIIAFDGPTQYVSTAIPANTLNVTYYIRVERTSPTSLTLNVFSDAARTLHIPGSPVSMTIPATITGLGTVQHANIARGFQSRQLTGYLDNLCIRRLSTSAASEITSQMPVRMFPNPTTGTTTLAFGEAIPTDGSITVSDLLGRNLLHETVESGSQAHSIALHDAPAGIYLVRLLDESGQPIWTGKLIKE
jgi:PKD repeat protein